MVQEKKASNLHSQSESNAKGSSVKGSSVQSAAPKSVSIVEVGLRDGLQNEPQYPAVEVRKELLQQLIDAGSRALEIGAFVSPKWVPAMACSEELVLSTLKDQAEQRIPTDAQLSVLIPNEKGMEIAIKLGVKEIAIFAACSESFSQRNTNCSIEESFQRLKIVAQMAGVHQIKVRGYLSTCFGCPFEGAVDPSRVVENVQRMLDLGVYEVSIGDTIGVASAGNVETLFSQLLASVTPTLLAGHFHDTRGQALANILKSYEMGITTFDSSIGGLGGCPYAPGATGNVATEEVVYLFDSMNVSTGLNLEKLIQINQWLAKKMNRTLSSRVGIAKTSSAFNKRISYT